MTNTKTHSSDSNDVVVRTVEAFAVDGRTKNWVFVRLDTGDLTGWGECYVFPGRDTAVLALVRELGRYMVGRKASDIKPFTTYALRDFGGKRASLELYTAISGIETAMWDVVGQAHGCSIHEMLGGSFRSDYRVYANGWSMNKSLGRLPIDELVTAAVGLVDSGFTALKFDPVPGPWRPELSAADEQSTIDCVKEVRSAVGDDVDLLIELHRRFTLKPALRAVAALEQFRPFWIEEPVRVEDLSSLAQVRRSTTAPIVSGETLYGKQAFLSLFAAEAVDIINPDVGACGGISELREISAMAEAFGVVVSPHNYNSTSVALAATLQASAGAPNYLITEYFVDAAERSAEISSHRPILDRGVVRLPEVAGLGAALNPEALNAYPASAPGLRSFGDSRPDAGGTR